jgi:hypothetical protein
MDRKRANSAHVGKLNQTMTNSSQVHVAKVSQAKFYEAFRVLPKFSHVPMAVINPSPKKIRPPREARAQSMDIFSNTVRLR